MGTAAPSPPSPGTVIDGAKVSALGVDIGSTHTKVVLIDIGDSIRERGIRSSPTPDDPEKLWSLIAESIRGLTTDTHPPLAAIGIASMAESGMLLGNDRNPIGPIVRWDARGTGHDSGQGLFDVLSAAETARLSRATGVPPTGKVPLATWHRLARLEPERWSHMAAWAGVADFVAHRLTGDLVTDHTLALRTMAYRLPDAGEHLPSGFEPEFLELVGLSPDRLPRVLAPGDQAGTLTPTSAAATGLTAGMPVFIAGHDHIVGMWGAGARTAATLANSMGTTEALLRVTVEPAPRAAALAQGMSVTRTVDGGAEVVLSGALGGALVTRWFDEHPDADRQALLRELDPLLSDGPFVLPYPRGRQSPFPDPRIGEHLIGVTETDESSFAALMAGLSLQLKWMADAQTAILGGDSGDDVVVFGGHIRHNASWLRAKSRALDRPLRVVSCDEPVATAAALLAAVRADDAPRGLDLPHETFSTASDHPTTNHSPTAALFTSFIAAAMSAHPGVQS